MIDYLKNFHQNPGINEEILANLEKELGLVLPEEYKAFLRISNGGEGPIGENSYVILWKGQDLLSMNQGYGVDAFAPGLLIFGSTGGGDAYGFDRRTAKWEIVEIPFIPMEWADATPLGDSFVSFLENLYNAE